MKTFVTATGFVNDLSDASTQNGKRVLSFTVRVEETYKDKTSKLWLPVSVWYEPLIKQLLDKGLKNEAEVIVMGRVSNQKTKDGYRLAVSASEVHLVQSYNDNFDKEPEDEIPF